MIFKQQFGEPNLTNSCAKNRLTFSQKIHRCMTHIAHHYFSSLLQLWAMAASESFKHSDNDPNNSGELTCPQVTVCDDQLASSMRHQVIVMVIGSI